MKDKSKYGFTDVKNDEALLFIETAVENGSDVSEALADLKMVDTLLMIKKLHLIVHPHIRTTKAGFSRKGSLLWNAIDSVVERRLQGQFD